MYAAAIDVKLHMLGPIISNATSIGGFGVDSVMARTKVAENTERYYLAGTLVKGLLGEAWQELGKPEWRKDFLGAESEPATNLPDRGRIFLEDFLDHQTGTAEFRTQFRNKIDPWTGSVAHGMFQIIESPWRSGEHVAFQGKVRILAGGPAQASKIHEAIVRGLHWVVAAGADRTAGFGRVTKVECGPLVPLNSHPIQQAGDTWDLEIRVNQPFCLAVRRIANNIFESDTIIAGAAVKGVIAEMIARDPSRNAELREHLHAIRFCHAFPAAADHPRPNRIPLSMASIQGDGEHLYDMALHAEPPTNKGELAFDVDWKDEWKGAVQAHFGWPQVDTELRVRTQIEGAIRKAKDENLFAYRMIVPHGNVWRGSVSLSSVPPDARSKVRSQLLNVLGLGLCGLGKTKVWASVESKPVSTPIFQLRGDNRLIVALQTPALLSNPRDLAPDGKAGDPSVEAMHQAYRSAWRELAGNSLELSHYFHRVSLAGGEYIRRRFQAGQQYRPYLLTEPGSVFVFDVKDKTRAGELATSWMANGLPIPESAAKFYHLEPVHPSRWWKHCPFLPENGYGEVIINPEVHEKQAIREEVGHAQ